MRAVVQLTSCSRSPLNNYLRLGGAMDKDYLLLKRAAVRFRFDAREVEIVENIDQ
jgi:hypothetical protein